MVITQAFRKEICSQNFSLPTTALMMVTIACDGLRSYPVSKGGWEEKFHKALHVSQIGAKAGGCDCRLENVPFPLVFRGPYCRNLVVKYCLDCSGHEYNVLYLLMIIKLVCSLRSWQRVNK